MPPNIFQRPAPRVAPPADPLAQLEVRRALMLHQSGRIAEASTIYLKILQSQPDQFECLHYLGVAHLQGGRAAEALPLLERALRLGARDASLQANIGLALLQLGRADEALRSTERALRLRPGLAEALDTQGWALHALHRPAEALAALDAALAANPKLLQVHARRGAVLGALRRFDEARAAFERAIALRPDDADAHGNLGTLLTTMGEGPAARAALARARALAPESMALRMKHAIAGLPLVRAADDDLDAVRATFEAELRAMLVDAEDDTLAIAHPDEAVGAAQPFYLAYQARDNAPLLALYGRLCARLMARWEAAALPEAAAAPQTSASPSTPDLTPAPAPERDARVRVGIVSSQVFGHSVWQALVLGWVCEIDRTRFHVSVFHLGHTEDAETALARERAEAFVAGPRPLAGWVRAIREARSDVLLYPELGMDALTPKLAALRLAPVQAASWGHPETTGLPTIDHYLSAEALEPPGAAAHYTESLARLPGLGACVARAAVRPRASAEAPDLAGLGIAPGATLFVCAGTPFKYAPEHDAVLVRIAQALPSAQFLFFDNGHAAALGARLKGRLDAAFAAAGLDPSAHLVLAPWLERTRFLGVLSQARVFLDTLGFSGFNTVMQAVECGLPVVTQRGEFLRGRLGSGLLEHLGLGEWVAGDDEAYIALALRLARDPQAHAHARQLFASASERMYGDTETIRALESFLVRAARA